MSPPTLRQNLHRQLDPTASPHRLSLTNRIICTLIVASSTFAILETEPTLRAGQEALFLQVETVFAVLFLIEYVARVWASAENARFGPGLGGRIRYMLTPGAIIDLIAALPVLFIFGVSEVFLLRAARLVRILRLARLGRFSSAMHHIGDAVGARRYELLLTAGFALFFMIVSSTLLYLTEHVTQPEAFGSIPRAMWWSVATLTTVGYGDVYPLTALGRIFAAITAFTAIGLIAMPAGIFAAAFSDAMQRQRAEKHADHDEGPDA